MKGMLVSSLRGFGVELLVLLELVEVEVRLSFALCAWVWRCAAEVQ
jgi:hypothetical protein